MKKVFAEIGVGNSSFFSTEIEEGDSEYRIPRFVRPEKIDDFYFRFWIGKSVFIVSTKEGFKLKKKDRNEFKLIFGIAGESI